MFLAFVGWFSCSPLLRVIQEDLQLTDQQLWVGNIASVTMASISRFVVGPLLDGVGPLRLQSGFLCIGGFFILLLPLSKSAGTLTTIRFLIGGLGSCFVCTQCWTQNMFTKEVAGTAQACAAGWGNVGGGVAHILLPFA